MYVLIKLINKEINNAHSEGMIRQAKQLIEIRWKNKLIKTLERIMIPPMIWEGCS